VRAVLGLFNAIALVVYKDGLESVYGRGVGRWYALLQMAQFHVIFYASRTLPNMFAFGLSKSLYLRIKCRILMVCSNLCIPLLSSHLFSSRSNQNSSPPKTRHLPICLRRCSLPLRNRHPSVHSTRIYAHLPADLSTNHGSSWTIQCWSCVGCLSID